jgi:hypothetical protein
METKDNKTQPHNAHPLLALPALTSKNENGGKDKTEEAVSGYIGWGVQW